MTRSAILVGAGALTVVLGLSAGPDSVRGQDSFNPCSLGVLPARCGWIEVPENRSIQGGRKLQLRAVVTPGSDPGRLADPIVLLLGGPGDGAASSASAFAPALRVLFPRRDLLFVDQRGTGESNGLFCPDDRPGRLENPAELFGSIFPPRRVALCSDALGERANLTRYLTPQAADDLADVLDALGYDAANLLGLSYGTRLAQVFARRHPERVRALVLSGVMSFDIRAPLHYARDAQDALNGVVEACRKQQQCRERYPRLGADIQKVWSVLDAGPVRVRHAMEEGEPPTSLTVSKGDVGYALRGMLYTPQDQDRIPAAFADAARGDWSTFVEMYLRRRVRFFATGMHLSVLCSEEVRFLSDDEIAAAAQGTFLGRHISDDMKRACSAWPLGELPPSYHDPFVTPVPTLLVSGEFDPVTPPRWGDRVLASHPRAYHIVVPNSGHGITAVRGGPGCVGGIIAAFVATAGTDAPATECLAETPAPAFRD